MLKVICDRCGSEVDRELRETVKVSGLLDYGPFDFCDGCLAVLHRFLGEFMKPGKDKHS
jgi:hypothetical protein